MATIVLSAVGAAAGSAIGGTALGLSSVVIGRAVGATLGRVIDQSLLGGGSQAVETGKVERFRIVGASEGSTVGQIYGRTRVGGQVIWASRFRERRRTTTSSAGGKGSAPKTKTTTFSYSVSLAIALCEGEIARIGRIWADGIEIEPDTLTMRVYTGAQDQLPDAKIEAIEGAGNVPAYRGLAYVVIENLQLRRFGNRVPQLSFEVVRPAQADVPGGQSLQGLVKGVALIPGSGEYALATTRVHYANGAGHNQSANVNSPSGKTDFATSLEVLGQELPNAQSTLLVASWFGDDLRCGTCQLKPKVEQKLLDGAPMPWRVSGLDRDSADQVATVNGVKQYGGTPADAAVIEAIAALRDAGKEVVFYPFILMDQVAGNGLTNPYTGAAEQPALPWRGRITGSLAPGVAGSPDQSLQAEIEVADFFGLASVSDFSPVTETGVKIPWAGSFDAVSVAYSGPHEWSYRRFILHYAHLCALAGGVDAFCIGSEMRGLTQLRGAAGFPAVEALKQLAVDVRTILGPGVKIGYAADWSEYFGYHPQDGSGDVYFHLDPLWAHPEIDFIGIDNYMPASDWRDGADHADAHWGAIYAQDYLQSNIEGGEGYDWYYPTPEARESQRRAPITDGAHGEDWIYRYKDLRSWWQNPHHERIGGVRQPASTVWQPQSKPFWFTEFGCAAVDKGTNQPNKFLDPKSSESSVPHFSSGVRDDLIQAQYLRAMIDYWEDPARNPVSDVYGGPMLDMSRAHAWAWDTRPFPHFPANTGLWSDGENYDRGHWLNGRVGSQALAAVVAEICARSGVTDVDVTQLYGAVRGYTVEDLDGARAALQPLMLAFGFDAIERDGKIVFRNRDGRELGAIDPEALVLEADQDGRIEHVRAPEAETAGRVRLTFVEAEGDYEARAAESIFPDEESQSVAASEFPLVMTQAEGRATTERWLAESRVARDRANFALPLSRLDIGAGDVVTLPDGQYRIDRIDQGESRRVEAVRVEPGVYVPSDATSTPASLQAFVPPVPVYPVFMDLPLLTGEESPHAPHLAVTANPWPGAVAVYSAPEDAGYAVNTTLYDEATIGVTESVLPAARPALWDRGPALRVRLFSGALSSADMAQVLNGANVAAIGDGSSDNWELFQFAEAQLVDPDTYELRFRLRGQAGSDVSIPAEWPEGSLFVLMDGVPEQLDLNIATRDLARHYRIGTEGRGYDDPSFVHRVEAFKGIGLRPLSPVHLRAREQANGDALVTWIRRTRIDGDSWSGVEVPLGEGSELYQLRVRAPGGAVLFETFLSAPNWTYGAAQRALDGPGVTVEVAQLSDQFGAGPFTALTLA
ncbi:baseplate multidomain protein megatron [Actibacterium ureilyticum]|uniref:baseplate multidomain protein megatron n=1 Tax=Actibacterium ureilyticum TaxID=1590614 RepID=UPI000BAAFEF2|nr:glycoside hydrolase/phage tail family protein [Actibacterium ureilyticum]